MTLNSKLRFSPPIIFFLGLFLFFLPGCVKSSVLKAVETDRADIQDRLDRAKLDHLLLKSELSKKETTIHDLKELISVFQRNETLHLRDSERLAEKNIFLSSELADLTRLNTDLNATTMTQDDRLEEMRRTLLNESNKKEKEFDHLKSTYDQLVGELEEEIREGEISITRVMNKLSVNLMEKILFDSGSSHIKPKGLKVLNRVGKILLNLSDKEIRVEGHTDNVPIGTRLKEQFPTNWELSAARAINVVRYFSEQVGVNARYLSAVGLADSRPVSENKSSKGRAKNRRIEIVLLPLDMEGVLRNLKPATDKAENPQPVTHAADQKNR